MSKSFVILIIFIGLITYLNNKIKTNNETNKSIKKDDIHEDLPYKKKKYLLSIAEKNFYEVLKLAIQDTNYCICPKVRLADIIYVGKTDKRQSYFNKIQSKHIDFLLCDTDTLRPIIAIELNDSSHLQNDRIKRDNFVNKALETAGLIIITFDVKHSYVVDEIKEKLKINKNGSELVKITNSDY